MIHKIYYVLQQNMPDMEGVVGEELQRRIERLFTLRPGENGDENNTGEDSRESSPRRLFINCKFFCHN